MKRQAKRIEFNNICFLLIVFLFVIITGRLLYISNSKVVDGTNMKIFASNRNMKKQILYANRGSIYDISGEALAHNVTAYTVIAYLNETRTTNQKNPQHVIDKEMTAELLAPLINMTKEKILVLLNKDVYQVELGPGGRDIGEVTKQEIEKLSLPGISFIKGLKREYPNGQFASYILGYAKKDDSGEITGEMGIESYYNDKLKGEDGYKIFQKDRHGYQIPDTPYKEEKAISGQNIYLTIDNNIQIFLENALTNLVDGYSPEWGILTVMDASSGAIVGSATYPTFDPRTKNISNYNNPLTSYTFEPGSTMKIFSFMAAMESGKYTGSDTYKSGTIDIKGTTVKDHNTKGWGIVTFDQGFTYSSNVAATNLAQKMGLKHLDNYYKKLGFSKTTGIELSGELEGKIDFKYDIELANASFGQGISVTPIQMLQAMTPVTNDGVLLKPYIIDKIIDPNNNEIIFQGNRTELGSVASHETINHIKDLMDETVNGEDVNITGSGFKTEAVTVIGKTGTAQVVGKNGQYLNGKYDYIRSFIGAFPKENPQYIIYIATNKLQGGNSILGRTIKEVVENISKNKYLSDVDDQHVNENIYQLSSLVNMSVESAKSTIDGHANQYYIIGNGNYIIKQYPAKNTTIHKNTKVFLLTNYTQIKMPDIIGWSNTEISALCNLINLKFQFKEYGFATSSSIPTEQIIDLNQTLIVDLKPKLRYNRIRKV